MDRSAARLSSGLPALDDALGGLLVGDNVVWAHAEGAVATVSALELCFAASTVSGGRPLLWVTAGASPAEVRSRFGRRVHVVDGRGIEPMALAELMVRAGEEHRDAGMVCDVLGPVATEHGPAAAAAMFEHACPRLFDLGPVACWRAPRALLRQAAIGRIRRTTQCLVSVLASRVRIEKADGRPRAVLGTTVGVDVDERGAVRAHAARGAATVVASALTRIADARGLNHDELAEAAGVTRTAISQALVGTRSLSLDTILTLATTLGMSMEEFFTIGPGLGYTVGRRDLRTPAAGVVTLLDDPDVLVRADLVRLGPRERIGPPVDAPHDQLVMVGTGLIQVDVGDDAPVLRSGDALALPEGVAVVTVENLGDTVAGVFWASRTWSRRPDVPDVSAADIAPPL